MVKIEFTPFTSNNNAQVMTIATVTEALEILWEEPIVIDITEPITEQAINDIVAQRISGFKARIEAIRQARLLEGITPLSIKIEV